ncbi:YqaJ viral recombinase family protein [Gilliamella sp. B3023]|uniref:lambda exonuclease family protein n=1 Tax=Gilliamella sp. B3023 TaxID=2817987 RepID=UPI00226A963D|nr:lambda exonuclease family protein [Gilliamella sp. B3023]MCX8674916.1 YqaJ viral recombinase family protein [Gilliamella sp. B3023]
MEQRTDEWFQARLGKVTASKISDVMTKIKNGYAASRQNYMTQLICERLTEKPTESYSNAAMQRGTELEPEARRCYELENLCKVSEVGFIPHPTIENAGASPDGLVNDDGLIEIKCPNTWTHLEFIQSLKPKREYILQMQWQMICTGRKWCDFVSYDDRLPDNLSYKCVRIYYDENLAQEIEIEVIKFLQELDERIKQIEAV